MFGLTIILPTASLVVWLLMSFVFNETQIIIFAYMSQLVYISLIFALVFVFFMAPTIIKHFGSLELTTTQKGLDEMIIMSQELVQTFGFFAMIMMGYSLFFPTMPQNLLYYYSAIILVLVISTILHFFLNAKKILAFLLFNRFMIKKAFKGTDCPPV